MSVIKRLIKNEYVTGSVLGCFAGFSMCYLLYFMVYPEHFAGSFFSLPVMLLCVIWQIAFRKTLKEEQDVKQKKRKKFFAWTFSFLFALSFLIGYQIQAMGMTALGFKGKFVILIASAGISMVFEPFAYKGLSLLDQSFEKRREEDIPFLRKSPFGFWKSFLLILLLWVPVFLAYYPAIMSYDFHRQSQEAYQGYIWFNDHHPLVHTFLIRVFFQLGEAMGSYQAAMAIFSGLQMMILAAVLAYSCALMGRLTGKKWPSVLFTLIYGLLPIHPVLAMSMTKDILFSAFFLLLILLMFELHFAQKKTAKAGLFIACTIIGVLSMLFRNNAVYAFAVFAVFYVLFSKGQRILYLMLSLLILAGGMFGKTAIRETMGAGEGSKVEMYSVVLQQFTRAASAHEEFLSMEDFEIINKYVDHTFWKEYHPAISDPIKGKVADTNYLRWKDDIPGMLKDWIRIGIHYPNDYLDAFFALTSGYFFLDDTSHAEVLGYGDTTNLGLLYTFNASKSDVFEGVESKSLWPFVLELYQKIVNGNCYMSWPVVSCLFKPAFYSWILWGVMLVLWYRKKYRKLIPCLLPFFYLLTLFLGPVVNMRYAYPVMICAPILIAWLLCPADWSTRNRTNKDTEDHLNQNRNANSDASAKEAAHAET